MYGLYFLRNFVLFILHQISLWIPTHSDAPHPYPHIIILNSAPEWKYCLYQVMLFANILGFNIRVRGWWRQAFVIKYELIYHIS